MSTSLKYQQGWTMNEYDDMNMGGENGSLVTYYGSTSMQAVTSKPSKRPSICVYREISANWKP